MNVLCSVSFTCTLRLFTPFEHVGYYTLPCGDQTQKPG